MSDNRNTAAELVALVSTPWTPDRAHIVRSRLHRKLARRRQTRRLGLAAALLLLVAGVWLKAPWTSRPGDRITRFADGSLARPLGARDRVEILAQVPRRTWVRLRGAAHFDVVPNPERRFHIDAGPVSVEVLGTAFLVEPQHDRVRVAVERGKVRVSWLSDEVVLRRDLQAGQADVFPPVEEVGEVTDERRPGAHGGPQEPPPPDSMERASDTRSEVPTSGRKPAGRKVAGRWQGLARNGRFDEAYRALKHEIATDGPRAVPDEPGSLLLAADAARLSRHPHEALPHLERVATRFHRDPRASLAAFTMALVLLEELGRPAEAARQFARSRRLAPAGDLAEDALAREVEAHFKAGNRGEARAVADVYLHAYPNGRRASAVRRYGGLE